MRTIHLVTLFVLSLFFTTCKEESSPVTTDTKVDLANDYFPVVSSYQWTFNSNTYSDSGKTYSNFDMKIDTATFRNGVFLALKTRRAGDPTWYPVIGLKDSGNVVYSLGDNPPPSTLYPLFKHTYAANEGTRETVTLAGTTYEAVKITMNMGNNKSYSLWFAKGVGFIKDSSSSGISIFSDNNQHFNVVIKSSLVSLQK